MDTSKQQAVLEGAPPDPDPYAAELGDWRAATPVWITAIDGQAIKHHPAHQVTTLVTPSRHTSFTTPSATALHLSSGWRAARSAAEVKATLQWTSGAVSPGVTSMQASIQAAPPLFDYFEAAMSAAMSSYAAIEAFCNSTVIERAQGSLTLRRRKGNETMTPEDVERRVSTDEKLKRIVPDLMGRPTPAGKSIWQKYVQLKDLRDSVTHFKRKDQARHASHLHEPTALQALLTADPLSFPETAIAVIGYFFDEDKRPRWLINPAWVRSTT